MCDDSFSTADAEVVCRQLGYSTSNVEFHGGAYYGSGSGPVWLDELTCSGDEMRLDHCGRLEWGTSDCRHSEDIGVKCGSKFSCVICLIAHVYIIYIYIYFFNFFIFILDQCLHPPYRQMKENYTKSQMSLSIVLTASLSKASLALDCQSLTESC